MEFNPVIIIAICLFVLLPVSLFCENLIVDQSYQSPSYPYFNSIQTAYNNCVNGDIITINEGIYHEHLNLNRGVNNITLQSRYYLTEDQSTIDNTVIDGDDNGRCIYIVDDSVTLSGLKMINGVADNGGGICANGSQNSYNYSLIICDCIIYDCISYFDNDSNHGGGIFIQKYTGTLPSNPKVISNTLIMNCHSGGNGGGIGLYEAHNFQIDNCKIISNCGHYKGGGILVQNCHASDITNCLIARNSLDASGDNWGGAICYCGCQSLSALLSNNTIVNNSSNNYDGIKIETSNSNITLDNNILLDESLLGGQYYALYNNFWTTGIAGTGNICELNQDELFVDAFNDDYHLIWGNGCVDGGNPSYPLDYDNSPIDMGCYVFEREEVDLTSKYIWTCYPVLDVPDGENNGTLNQDCVTPGQIWNRYWRVTPSLIKVWVENDDMENPTIYGVYYEPNNSYDWNPGNLYSIHSWQGFKINAGDIHYNAGYLLDEGQSSLYHYELTLSASSEHWLGYYLKTSQEPFAAFPQDILDNLLMIKTKTWCASRPGTNYPWFTPSGNEPHYTFNYRDMVIIQSAVNIDNFHWNGAQGSLYEYNGIERPVAKHFVWEEELDYQPVFVEFTTVIPQEIGVFVNGECKGAQVVEDSLCQICAYILEEDEGSEINFVFYSDRGKQFDQSYQVVDIFNGERKQTKLKTDKDEPFFHVIFEDNDPIIIPTQIMNCKAYPNPFNPSTTISFELKEPARLDLTIFNVKAQPVKCFRSCNLSAGEHSICWDGRNDNGKRVSSGVYFFELSSNGEKISKKVIMIK